MRGQFFFLASIHVTYDLGNLSSWLTAIGTIASVIISLFFGLHRVKKPNIGFELRKGSFFDTDARLSAKNFCSQYVRFKAIKNKNVNFLKIKGTTLNEINLSPIESKSDNYMNYVDLKFSGLTAKIKFKDLVSRRCITVYFLRKNNVWKIVRSVKYLVFKTIRSKK